MNEAMKQQLSLLLDGELGPEESVSLLRRIETDPELRAQWRRYCLMSEVMRLPGAILTDEHFVDRVSAALDHEPVILAPGMGPRRTGEKIVSWGLAAALAVVAVLVGKSMNDHTSWQGADIVATLGPTESAETASATDAAFRDYLLMHNETAYMAGAQGMLPYVRAVSFEPTR